MPLWGFKERRTADTLVKVAREREGEVKYITDISLPEGRRPVGGSVIIHLDEELNAATFNQTTRVAALSSAIGYVYRRLNTSDIISSQVPESTPASGALVPSFTEDGKCNIKRIWNSTPVVYEACSFVECVVDNYGDLYVSGPALETELTTTTSHPHPAPTCSGRCKWVWDETSALWELEEDNCDTTSTTTTTPGAATTTTTPPCVCGDPSFTPTSTTYSPSECVCAEPQFCGAVDEDCTYTYCVDSDHEHPEQPDCSTTTSSTTTTCECTTTTSTTSEGCSGGCEWYAPSIFGWERVANNCDITCPCNYPTEHPFPCSSATTECITSPPTTTTSAEPCTGRCSWFFGPLATGGNAEGNGWYLVATTCHGGTQGVPVGDLSEVFRCPCPPPSEDGELCGTTVTYCERDNLSSDTTSTTTTQDPCEEYCENTSTTTTTEDPCTSESCIWRWNVAEDDWVLEEDNCTEDCPCYPPSIQGTEDCELSETNCNTAPTTTTSTTEPPCGTYPGGEGAGACCFPVGSIPYPNGSCIDSTEGPQCVAAGGTWFECRPCSEILSNCVLSTTTTTTAGPVGCCSDPGAIENCDDLTESDCATMHPGWDWNAGLVCCTGTPACAADLGSC